MRESKEYQILEHTADIKIKIFGKTLKDIYINAAKAMASILNPSAFSCQPSTVKETLEMESNDKEILLADFLNEILAKSQINKMVYQTSSINYQEEEKKAFLKTELIGYPVECFDEDIKAATYHGLSIKQKENDTWEAIVLFDV